MNGIIIFVCVCMAILLYLWALTQSHCNDNEKKIVGGFEAVKDTLKDFLTVSTHHETRITELEKQVAILAKCVKPTIGYDADLTTASSASADGKKRVGIIRIESGNLSETLDKEAKE